MSEPSKAVFLSYASQDAEAAKQIAEALRAAGVEVWFDQAELVGGDAWDAKIRKQIAECALFVPVISANTQARREGYFRLEWKLAAQRTHMIADGTPFLLPVVVDDTRDAEALVPGEFKQVQWTRLQGGETPPAFCTRVTKLLAGGEATAPANSSGAPSAGAATSRSRAWVGIGWAAVGIVFALVYAIRPLWLERRAPNDRPAAQPAAAVPEAQRLVQQAKALIDDDPLAVRESFRAAVDLCARAVALDAANAEAWATLSRANRVLRGFYNEGGEQRWDDVRQQAERAMRLAPESVESQLAMALYEGWLGATADAARQRLEALWERFPQDKRIARWLATFSQQRGDLDAAQVWAERADALPGGDPFALAQMGWGLWSRGRLEEVGPAVERALARAPASAALHLKLRLQQALGDLAGAREVLARFPPALMREDRVVGVASEVHLLLGDPQDALATLRLSTREFLEEGGYFSLRGYLAGEALAKADKPRAAEVEFRAALKAVEARLAREPRDSRLMRWRALLLARLGEREAGAQHYDTASELGASPNALTLVLLGREEEAIAEIERSLRPDASDWGIFLQSLRRPAFDPLRDHPRFQAGVRAAEARLAAIRRDGK